MPGTGSRRYKVGRVIEAYGLDGLGDDLVARWRGERGDRESLRDLAARVNRRVVSAAMADAGVNPMDGEVLDVYRRLTGDDVSSGMRTQTERTLERAGVDVDALREDFVSHQAVHTYLREARGAEAPSGDGERVARAGDQIQRLRSRAVAVTEDKLAALRDADRIDVGEFDVTVDARVFCEDCGSQYAVAELLERGGCDCEP